MASRYTRMTTESFLEEERARGRREYETRERQIQQIVNTIYYAATADPRRPSPYKLNPEMWRSVMNQIEKSNYKKSTVMDMIITIAETDDRVIEKVSPHLCTVESYMIIIKRNPRAFRHVWEPSLSVCAKAIKINPMVLEFIGNQTVELCDMAMKLNPNVIKHVRYQTLEMCKMAMNANPENLQYIFNQTPEMCMAAIRKNAMTLMWANAYHPDMCQLAVNIDPNTAQYVKNYQKRVYKQGKIHNGYENNCCSVM